VFPFVIEKDIGYYDSMPSAMPRLQLSYLQSKNPIGKVLSKLDSFCKKVKSENVKGKDKESACGGG